MNKYKITRSETYLMHKKGGGYSDGSGKTRQLYKKQSDIDGDGKLEWTEYGKAWRREQYRKLKEGADQTKSGIAGVGTEVEGIVSGKKYDKRRAQLKEKASKMSDEELRNVTNRLNLEQSYATAVMNSEARRGKVTFGKVMAIVGPASVLLAGASTIAANVIIAKKALKENKG